MTGAPGLGAASASPPAALAAAPAGEQPGRRVFAWGVGGLLASVPLAPALLLSPEERARREKRREELMASISRAQLEALARDPAAGVTVDDVEVWLEAMDAADDRREGAPPPAAPVLA